MSDLHLEFHTEVPKLVRTAPVLILAGDIGFVHDIVFRDFIVYCSDTWESVVFVPGNHEFYARTHTYAQLDYEYDLFFGLFDNVVYLNNKFAVVNGVYVYGAVMWSPVDPWADAVPRKFVGLDVGAVSFEHLRGVERFMRQFATDRKLVVTHFPMTRQGTMDPKYEPQELLRTRYFANEWLKFLPDRAGTMFAHGHTHFKCDVMVDGARVVSNPWGYPVDQTGVCVEYVYRY